METRPKHNLKEISAALHVGSRVKFQETEKRKVSFMDLINLPKRIWPPGLRGPKYIFNKKRKEK